ncbi:Retrovirus-related Pol polyprotein from transposon 412, partial [Araneus ventricosus]
MPFQRVIKSPPSAENIGPLPPSEAAFLQRRTPFSKPYSYKLLRAGDRTRVPRVGSFFNEADVKEGRRDNRYLPGMAALNTGKCLNIATGPTPDSKEGCGKEEREKKEQRETEREKQERDREIEREKQERDREIEREKQER